MNEESVSRTLSQRRFSRRRALSIAATGAGGFTFFAACGGRRSPTNAGSNSSGQLVKPKSGGQLSLSDSYDPSTFDPATKLSEVGRLMVWTNDSLLSFKTGSVVPYDQVIIQPGLADRWESPDGQSYTFHLHPSISFANLAPVNGRAMTGDDVKWTYEYLARSGQFKNQKLAPSSAASMLAGLDSVQMPDPNTVVVRFTQPYSPFIRYAASQWLPILPHEIFDADGNFSKRMVGTGPFQLDVGSSQRGSRWVYKKNPTYYRTGLPYLDQVNDVILTENSTENAAFQSKQIDILDYNGLTADTVQLMTKSVPNAATIQHLQPQYYHLYMNVSHPPLDDQRVRQAMALSVDRDAFIKTFANGQGQWALAASVPGLFTEAEIKQIVKLDPAQAKQIVTQAGHPDGVDVEFIYATSYGDQFVSILQLLQSQFKKGGINVTLKGLEHATESGRRRSGDYQLGITPRGQGLPLEPDSALYGMFYPGSTDNQTRVNDPQLTPLLEAQRRELDPAKRKDLWRQAIRRVNEEPWAIGIFFGTALEMHQPGVKNFSRNMADESSARYLTEVWQEK